MEPLLVWQEWAEDRVEVRILLHDGDDGDDDALGQAAEGKAGAVLKVHRIRHTCE